MKEFNKGDILFLTAVPSMFTGATLILSSSVALLCAQTTAGMVIGSIAPAISAGLLATALTCCLILK